VFNNSVPTWLSKSKFFACEIKSVKDSSNSNALSNPMVESKSIVIKRVDAKNAVVSIWISFKVCNTAYNGIPKKI
jgi:hypothetical protein